MPLQEVANQSALANSNHCIPANSSAVPAPSAQPARTAKTGKPRQPSQASQLLHAWLAQFGWLSPKLRFYFCYTVALQRVYLFKMVDCSISHATGREKVKCAVETGVDFRNAESDGLCLMSTIYKY